MTDQPIERAIVAAWPRLLSVDGAAGYLSISPNTLRSLGIQSRQIGRRVLYDIRDLDRYVDRMAGDDLPPAAGDKPDAGDIAAEERAFFLERAKRRG